MVPSFTPSGPWADLRHQPFLLGASLRPQESRLSATRHLPAPSRGSRALYQIVYYYGLPGFRCLSARPVALHAARSTGGLSLAAHSLEKCSSNGYPFRSLSVSIQIRAAGARARRNHVGQTIRIDCPELSRSSASAGTKYVRKAFHVSAFALGANAWIPPFSRQRQCGRNSPPARKTAREGGPGTKMSTITVFRASDPSLPARSCFMPLARPSV